MECTLYLTDYCNFKCSYCYQEGNKKSNFLSNEKLEDAIDFMVVNNDEGENINLTFLGGEPLLNKELIYKALEIIKSKYSQFSNLFKYKITTNCSLLDDNLIKVMKENDFYIRISIDGNKETHNLNRKSIDNEDNYEIILNNAKKIKEQNLRHSIRMTITSNNVHWMYKNLLYFYNMGFRDYCIGLDYFANWNDEKLEELNNQLQKIEDFYVNRMENNEDVRIDLFDGKFTFILIARKSLFCSGGSKGHICINSNGELYPCTYVVNDNKWKMGTVNKGIDSEKFNKSVRESVAKKIKCINCDIKFTCHGRKCGFLNYAQTNYLNKSSENLCSIEKMLYNHDKSVMTRLYKKRNFKIMNMLDVAEKYNLKLSDDFQKVIKEN